MAKRIQTDELDQWHEYGVYTPARLIDLSGDITEDKAVQFIKNIRLLDHVNNNDITVLLNTEGGSVHQGMAIVDAVKECNSRIIMHAVGPVWSMGAIIFQSGDLRKISSNATIMIHVGSEVYEEDHKLNLARWIEENNRIGNDADEILFLKMKKANPKLTKNQFEKLLQFDTIYTAQQAVKLGLADEIVAHREFL